MHHFVSVNDISRIDLDSIFDLTLQAKNGKLNNSLINKIIASCFFESSTRTKLSFDVAIHRLGGKIIGFDNLYKTSFFSKEESLYDTIHMLNIYADAIIIRHFDSGSSKSVSTISKVPIINAGDGCNEHPTQALSDLFTIKDKFNEIDNLSIAVVGDLKYSRAIHSLILLLIKFFNIKIYLIFPKKLYLPDYIVDIFRKKNISFFYCDSILDILSCVDILYMCRLQKERFKKHELSYTVNYVLNRSMLENYAKDHLMIMHPLPRSIELCTSVDNTKYAWYFNQARNSVFVRQALLYKIFYDK